MAEKRYCHEVYTCLQNYDENKMLQTIEMVSTIHYQVFLRNESAAFPIPFLPTEGPGGQLPSKLLHIAKKSHLSLIPYIFGSKDRLDSMFDTFRSSNHLLYFFYSKQIVDDFRRIKCVQTK